MRPHHPQSILLALVATLLAAVAHAGIPNVGDTSAPNCISLVGSNGSIASPAGQFTVTAHDLAAQPLAGASIVVDLASCPDLFFCPDQLDPGITVNCQFKSARKLTAADGSVQFTLLGRSNGTGNAVTLLNGGRIFCNGVLIKLPTVSAYDLDGSGGIGANDLSAWLTDFASGQPFGRSDYDCSGSIGANDLSLWLTAFGSGTMVQSCASQCP